VYSSVPLATVVVTYDSTLVLCEAVGARYVLICPVASEGLIRLGSVPFPLEGVANSHHIYFPRLPSNRLCVLCCQSHTTYGHSYDDTTSTLGPSKRKVETVEKLPVALFETKVTVTRNAEKIIFSQGTVT
jgi:hypothetical protein